MSKKIDPFFISKVHTTFFQKMEDGSMGAMFMENTFGEKLWFFDGNSDELEALIIDKCMISSSTESLKVITVFGTTEYEYREDLLRAQIENLERQLDDEDGFNDNPEERAYSFFLDNRSENGTK